MPGLVEQALLQRLRVAPVDPSPDTRNAVGQALAAAMPYGMGALDQTPRATFAPPGPPDPVRAALSSALTGGAAGGGKASKGWNQSLASRFGLRESSGYRDPHHNAAVGGVPNSFHTQRDQYGQSRAYDFVGSEAQMQAAAAEARRMGATEVLIHAVKGGRHLHVAF